MILNVPQLLASSAISTVERRSFAEALAVLLLKQVSTAIVVSFAGIG